MSEPTYPPCWTYEDGEIWAPSPNGDAVTLAMVLQPDYFDEQGKRHRVGDIDTIGTLMAAAPELVAALKAMTDLKCWRYQSVLTDKEKEALGRARAALAKAGPPAP